MTALRIPALMFAVAVFSICSVSAHAQQEVDPDHFDQKAAVSAHARGAKTQNHPSENTVQRNTKKKLASTPSHKKNPPRSIRPVSSGSEAEGD